jgi:hypothetical protein
LGIELRFTERPIATSRLEIGVHDELGCRWITADVALGPGIQLFDADFPEDIPEIEVGVRDVLDVAATYFTEVAGFACRHDFAPAAVLNLY